MPELQAIETPKTAGFVQRGSNYARKQERMKQEEEEIAKLEAKARGEEVEERRVGADSQVRSSSVEFGAKGAEADRRQG